MVAPLGVAARPHKRDMRQPFSISGENHFTEHSNRDGLSSASIALGKLPRRSFGIRAISEWLPSPASEAWVASQPIALVAAVMWPSVKVASWVPCPDFAQIYQRFSCITIRQRLVRNARLIASDMELALDMR